MDGKPATDADQEPGGPRKSPRQERSRDGGSYYDRIGKIACWNSVMDNDRYLVQKWNEFSVA